MHTMCTAPVLPLLIWVLTSQILALSIQCKKEKKNTAINTIVNKVFQIVYGSWTKILDCLIAQGPH